MQILASAVEIDEFLNIVQHKIGSAESDVITMLKSWHRAQPHVGYGAIGVWSQFYMVQHIISRFALRRDSNNELIALDRRRELLENQSRMMLHFAGAAVDADILALASKYLKEYRELCNTENLAKVSVLMVDVFVSHVLKLAERQRQKCTVTADSKGAHRYEASDVTAIARYFQTSTKMFDNPDILELVGTLPRQERTEMASLEAKTFAKAAQFYMEAGVEKITTEECFTRALEVFEKSCELIPKVGEDRAKSEPTSQRARIVFISFLADVLTSEYAREWVTIIDQEKLLYLLCNNVLDGMTAGDQECSNYFPQLCEMIPPFPRLVEAFEAKVLADVPAWTCLRWTSQLLALVNGPIGPTIGKVLEKMAKQYPSALFYEFRVTCGDDTRTQSNPSLQRLSILLSNPVMEKFVDALRLIHHPELRLKEGLREVAKMLENGSVAAAKMRMAQVWQECFSTEHPSLGGKIGHYNREWARKARRDMEKHMGRDGSNVTAKTVTSAREWIMNHFSVIPGKIGISKDMKCRLGDFAEWLDEFDHTKCRLELPGQYASGWGKPDPSTHVYILSIQSTLGVLMSKQLPKQITFHCSDQNEYTFLVKGGEDLRLDQRIEQLFDVMNQILAGDPGCRGRDLRLKTYRVVPMTKEVGMIEWLHGTSTIKGTIEKQLLQDPRCADLQSNKRAKLQLFNTTAAKTYEAFLMKQRGSTFGAKVAAPSTADVESTFAAVQALIPADLLRRRLIQFGSDFEDFISIRGNFSSSLAVFNACSYLLGIGDRHMDNFLLDHRSGRVIGIDFGISFGAGASVLPVPELIPFRFTRQMQTVLQPYDSAILLVQDMQAVFEALREKKQVVESVMNVFLHEPLLDWQQSTTTHQRELFVDASQEGATQKDDTQRESVDGDALEATPPRTKKRARRDTPAKETLSTASSSADAPTIAWLPDVKVTIARRKLDGYSPRVLLKEELAQNPHLAKLMPRFHALIDTAVQTEVGIGSMSSLAQAQELVGLATAPDLLGRTYHGWMPWL
ncbi:hypothetical protein PINS_up001624 [Pythium insidiosum]|nr:hypothetical protein PINS_up001624 [Pythium insidiosum]